MDGQQQLFLFFYLHSPTRSRSRTLTQSLTLSQTQSLTLSLTLSQSLSLTLSFSLSCSCLLVAIFVLSFCYLSPLACKLLPLYLVKERLLPCGFAPLSRVKVRRGKHHRFPSGFARSVLTAVTLPSVRRRKHPGLPSQTAPFVGANSEGPPPAPGAPPSSPAPFSVIVYHVLPC